MREDMLRDKALHEFVIGLMAHETLGEPFSWSAARSGLLKRYSHASGSKSRAALRTL